MNRLFLGILFFIEGVFVSTFGIGIVVIGEGVFYCLLSFFREGFAFVLFGLIFEGERERVE